MNRGLGQRYRDAWAYVVAAYALSMAVLVLVTGLNPPLVPIAIMVCLAAVPLEAVAYNSPKLRPALISIYIIGFALTFFLLNLRLAVEWVILILIGCAFIAGKIVTFGRDWAVFIIVVIAWQVTDGLATLFKFPWHYHAMIYADKIMFVGNIPAQWLQERLFNPHRVSWLDVLSVIVYSFHFLLPLTAGFVLWILNRQLYYRYAVAFCLAAVLGFATYVVFPAVPPWLAAITCTGPHGTACQTANNHYIIPMIKHTQMYVTTRLVWLPHFHHYFAVTRVHKLSFYSKGVRDVWNYTMKGWISKNNGNLAFGPFHMGFDQVGAIPSEHVMYPTLVFLFFRKQFGSLANWMVLYILLVMFVIVYMGQHYVIDGVIGVAYAAIVYAVVMRMYPRVVARIRPSATRSPAERPPKVVPIPEISQAAASQFVPKAKVTK